MLGFFFAIIAGLVRNYMWGVGVWLVTFGAYSAIDISYGTKPEHSAAIVGLGFLAASAAVWCVLGFAVGATVRWLMAHLHRRHSIRH